MALKRSSEVIAVGISVAESAANTFTEGQVDLQLNPLDNEVFVVSAIDLDPLAPDNVAGANTQTFVSLTTTSQTSVANLNRAACLANATLDIRQDAGSITGVPFTRTSLDSPPAALDYIGIISTNDFYVQIKGTGNTAAKSVFGKLWGYRAKADAATYAALVQSEVLSS